MKNQIIDPRYLKAVRQNQKIINAAEHPLQRVPAYVRKHLTPRVEIGRQHDSSQPIKIQPAIHTPKKERLLFRTGFFIRKRFGW